MYKDCVICFYMLISEQGMTPIGGLIYEQVRDANPKIWLEPLKETNLGVACALFHTKRYQLKWKKLEYQMLFKTETETSRQDLRDRQRWKLEYFLSFLWVYPSKDTLTAKNNGVLSWTPLRETRILEFYPLVRQWASLTFSYAIVPWGMVLLCKSTN